jgi:hypothetical protein
MATSPNTPQGRQQLIPFRLNTQQVFQQNQTDNGKAHALGSTVSYRIDKYGGLSGILFYLYGTVTLSNAGALANLGPWNLVNRFRLTLNNNAVTVVDIDGYHAYLLGLIADRAFGADGAGNYTPHSATYSAPVAMGANTWVLPYFIPCSLNQGSDVLTGMINMQAQTANLNLDVVLASAGTDAVSNFSSLSLTGEVHNFVYELRKSTETPPLVLCTRQQKTENITAVGLTRHEIIPQGDLYSLLGTVILNGSRNSADVTNLQYVAGTNKFNYIENPRSNHWQWQRNYAKPAITGVFARDFFFANENPNSGDFRDIVHTNSFTKLEWIANIASGATLGSGNNFFHCVETRVIPLAL